MNKAFSKDIRELINEGIAITRRANERDILYEENPPGAFDVLFQRYVLWKLECIKFFQKHKIKGYLFIEGDSVPKFKSGIEYGDIHSKESQELIKNIRAETSKKLEALSKISSGEDDIPQVEKKKHLISKDAEGFFYYGDALIELSKSNIAYDLFDILYINNPSGGFTSYEDIGKKLRKKNMRSGSAKSIQNALGNNQGFLRIAKIGKKPIPPNNPDGKELIEMVRGKGLQFNNPVI